MTRETGLNIGALTDVGRARERNEDRIGTPALLQVPGGQRAGKGELLAVADGMGGHAGGDVASRLAIDTLYQRYYGDPSTDRVASLRAAVEGANQQVHARRQSAPGQGGMGTTLVAAVIDGDQLLVANVGDSRAYLARGGQLRQLTRDHSWVAESLAAGYIGEEEARRSAQRNLITRALGQRPEVQVDIFRERLASGDTLLLCSDGLTNEVRDHEIAQAVSQQAPQQAAGTLVALANQRGGRDNISAVVVQVQRQARPFPVLPVAAASLALVVCGVLAVMLVLNSPGWPFGGATATATPAMVQITQPPVPAASSAESQQADSPTATASLLPAPSATPTPSPSETATATSPPTDTPTSTPSPAPTFTKTLPPGPTKIPGKVQVKLPDNGGCPTSIKRKCTQEENLEGLQEIFGQELEPASTVGGTVPLSVNPVQCVRGMASELEFQWMPLSTLPSYLTYFQLNVGEGEDDIQHPVRILSIGYWPSSEFPIDHELTVCGRPRQQEEQSDEELLAAEIIVELDNEDGPTPWLLPQQEEAPLWLFGKGEDLAPWSCWPLQPEEIGGWANAIERHGWPGQDWILSYARWEWDPVGNECGPGFRPVRLGQAGPAIFREGEETYMHFLGITGG